MSRLKLTILGISVVVAAIGVWGVVSRKQTSVVTEHFFPELPLPKSLVLVNYGTDRSVFGDSSSAIVFTLNESDFRSLAGSAGFSKIEVGDDPNHWRLGLCNEVLARLVDPKIKVASDFDCYSKVSPGGRQRMRLYYDKKEHLAIGICFISSKNAH
jgi:hypothetical protein